MGRLLVYQWGKERSIVRLIYNDRHTDYIIMNNQSILNYEDEYKKATA